MTTATMTRAGRLVTQEERAERQVRIERKAAALQAEAAAEQTRQQRERARERVIVAEAEAMEFAPVVTLTYADVQVRITLRGHDEVERQVIGEAVSRASRIFSAAFRGHIGRVRAAARANTPAPGMQQDPTLMNRLTEELRHAIRIGAAEVIG